MLVDELGDREDRRISTSIIGKISPICRKSGSRGAVARSVGSLDEAGLDLSADEPDSKRDIYLWCKRGTSLMGPECMTGQLPINARAIR